MTEVTWSPQSLGDLESIRDYVAQDSAVYADLVVQRIVTAIERLEMFPESGRIVPEREVAWLREVIVRPYRGVYRLRNDAVEIVTIFRASRLFPLRGEQ